MVGRIRPEGFQTRGNSMRAELPLLLSLYVGGAFLVVARYIAGGR
jgi:hypothetical protein